MTGSGLPTDRSWNLGPGDVVVPHCTVRSRLGGGSSYETYDAADDRLFTPVVIKVLRPHLVSDTDALRHLRREIALLDRIRHPLIVRWLHHDSAGARPYVALEKLPGQTVEHLTRLGGPLPADRVVDLGMGLATTLHYLRGVDVIHLDVMPRNVMMADRIPRLIDFDLARTSEQAARLGGPTGSPRCRAPEQCDPPASGTATFATDVWGLGMTLYMAATNDFPFPEGTTSPEASTAERFPQLSQVAPRLPDTFPARLADVVAACLETAASRRPRPADVYFALQALSSDGDTSVRPGGSTLRPQTGQTVPDDRERFERALQAKRRRRRP